MEQSKRGKTAGSPVGNATVYLSRLGFLVEQFTGTGGGG